MEQSKLYKENNKDIISNILETFNEKIQKDSKPRIKIIDIDFNNKNFEFETFFNCIFLFLNDIMI